MGNHIQDYFGELYKHRLDKHGNELSIETVEEKNNKRKDVSDRVH